MVRQGSRRHHGIAGEHAAAAGSGTLVTEPGTPGNRRIQWRGALVRGHGRRERVALGLEPELLAGRESVLVLELEHERLAARGVTVPPLSPVTRYSAVFKRAVSLASSSCSVNGRGSSSGRPDGTRSTSAPCGVAIVLQLPVEDSGAAVGEDDAQRVRLDGDFARLRLAEHRLRERARTAPRPGLRPADAATRAWRRGRRRRSGLGAGGRRLRRWRCEVGLIGVENDERQQNRDEDPAFHEYQLPLRDRIDAVTAPWSAAGDAARREPRASHGAVGTNRLGRIVGAGRREPARRRQVGRRDHFIRANRDEEHPGGEAGGRRVRHGVVSRGRHGNRPQGW